MGKISKKEMISEIETPKAGFAPTQAACSNFKSQKYKLHGHEHMIAGRTTATFTLALVRAHKMELYVPACANRTHSETPQSHLLHIFLSISDPSPIHMRPSNGVSTFSSAAGLLKKAWAPAL